MRTLRSITVQE
nr:immunoglobulin heavy chain junction region [Mus musculus]